MDGEIVARVERRRHWTPREKAELLAEIEAAGGQVSTVARRHGIARSLLYNWRASRKASLETPMAPGFIQLGVVADRSATDSARRIATGMASAQGAGFSVAERAGVMEIDLPDGIRVRVDTDVDEQALRRVMSVVRGLR